MKASEQTRFDDLYARHLRALKLQGMTDSTIALYAHAVRRLAAYFDRCPDNLTTDELEIYFADLIEDRSWSTVKVDRNGVQFFWKHVLKQDWSWVKMIKAPSVRSLPDILSSNEIERMIGATRKLRYRVFLLVTYSMGLRLDEALSLEVGDIDGERRMVHIRRGKGHKDRMVPLPDRTYDALREFWSRHRNPRFLFPKASGTAEQIRNATTHMDRGGAQSAMKAVVKECGIKKKYRSTRCVTATPLICWSKA